MGWCFFVILLFPVICRLEPGNELSHQRLELFFGLAIIQNIIFIKLLLARVPVNKKLITEHALIVKQLAEGAQVLLLVWKLAHEVKDDCLEEVHSTVDPILLNKLQEHVLIFLPALHGVAWRGKHTAEQDVELIVRGDVKTKLHSSYIIQELDMSWIIICDHTVDILDELF